MLNGAALTDLVYVYDGSFFGLLTCVFESYERKEIPTAIQSDNHTLLITRNIATDQVKAQRVENGIKKKAGTEVYSNCVHTYLSCLENKELHIMNYIRIALVEGHKTLSLLSEPTVMTITKAVKNLFNERHRFIEFIRFSIVNEALISVIEPKSQILPLLSQHFIQRFPNEKFMIYDSTHGMALFYIDKRAEIMPVDEFEMPEVDAEEKKFRELWRLFYDTIEIKPRHNEKCRQNLMPKWYWKNMTEFMRDQ